MKEKDLTSSSVHLYRRGIILGKIPPGVIEIGGIPRMYKVGDSGSFQY